MTHLRVAQFTGRQVHPGNKIDHWREPGKKTDFGRKTMVGADNKRHGTAKVQKYRKALNHLILCPYLSVLLSGCFVSAYRIMDTRINSPAGTTVRCEAMGVQQESKGETRYQKKRFLLVYACDENFARLRHFSRFDFTGVAHGQARCPPDVPATEICVMRHF
jgi:hypothetical protein